MSFQQGYYNGESQFMKVVSYPICGGVGALLGMDTLPNIRYLIIQGTI
jgi:hypothetical protein